MRIVSEKSEADVAHHHALERVEWRLRELAANLLRIIRGAGKPYEMMLQMAELVEAIQAYQAVVGRAPWEEFNRAVDVSRDIKDMQHWNAEDRHRDDAEHQIIQGVLQVVASRLVRQLNQGNHRTGRDVRWPQGLRILPRQGSEGPFEGPKGAAPPGIMLDRLSPIGFDRSMATGRTRPVLLTCEYSGRR